MMINHDKPRNLWETQPIRHKNHRRLGHVQNHRTRRRDPGEDGCGFVSHTALLWWQQRVSGPKPGLCANSRTNSLLYGGCPKLWYPKTPLRRAFANLSRLFAPFRAPAESGHEIMIRFSFT